MNIYVLTDGNYSDYHIIGVFTDEAMAEKAKAVAGGDIEEWESDEIGKDNRFNFCVNMGDNDTYVYFEHDPSRNLNQVRHFGKFTSRPYGVSVMAENKDHAIKIASDLVAQYKALNGEQK